MRIRTTILFFTTLLLCTCGEAVRFEEPQPARKSNEKRIPDRIAGQYQSLDDSAMLIVTNGLIVKHSISYFSDKVDSVDLKEIKGDTAYFIFDGNIRLDVRVVSDSAFLRLNTYDTLFDFSRGDVLRKYKGHYFLNERFSTKSWHVTTLTRIDNDGLTLGRISTQNDIDILREVTETRTDTIFSFRPTKRQMKQFLKEKGFSDKDTFIKIEE